MWLLRLSTVLTIFFGLSTPLAAEPTQATVKIGAIIPLTGFGAAFGVSGRNALELLTAEYNNPQRRFRYRILFEDGQCGSGRAPAAAAQRLLGAEQVKFLITGCSGETLVAAPIAQRRGALTMAICSTHAGIRELGDLVFRSFYNIGPALDELAELIQQEGRRRLVLLAEENAFTQGMADTMQKTLGATVLRREDFSSELPDIRALLLRLRSLEPDAIFLACAGAESCVAATIQARRQGLTQPIYSYYYFDQPDVQAAVGAAGYGIKFLSSPAISAAAPEYKAFWQRLQERYGDEQKDEFISRSAYDGLKAILDGIEAVGPDPHKVSAFLADYRVHGALGMVSFDAAGDLRDLKMGIKELKAEGAVLRR